MKLKSFTLIFGSFYFLISCGLSTTEKSGSFISSQDVPVDPTLVVIGDSLSSGVLSSTRLGNSEDFVKVIERSFGSIGEAFAKGTRDFSISKDEIIHLFESDYSKIENSFFFTSESFGLRETIANKHHLSSANQVPVKGVFKWGSEFDDSEKLMKRLIKKDRIHAFGDDFEIAQKQKSYVALSFGGNDYCKGNSSEEFRADLENTINIVRQSIPEAHFILLKLANIDELRGLDHDYNLKISINKKILNKKVSIEESFEITSCTKLQESFCSRGFAKENLWKEYNTVMDQVIETHKSKNNFSTIETQNLKLEKNHLAVDCFHPSREGHEQLGKYIKLN